MAEDWNELEEMLTKAEAAASDDLEKAIVAVCKKLLESIKSQRNRDKQLVNAIVQGLKTQRQLRQMIGSPRKQKRESS